MRNCRILIADDHKIISYGIQLILKNLSSLLSFEFDEAINGNEAIKLVKTNLYDLIILDINMPETDFFKLVQDILANKQSNKILVYSNNSELLYAKRLYNLGVKGYLSKDAPAIEVNKAINNLLDGYTYVSNTMKEVLIKDVRFNIRNTGNPFEMLTNREIQVAQCFINGETINSIINMLNLHPSSVSTYKNRIFQKLQINSLFELRKLAEINGFT